MVAADEDEPPAETIEDQELIAKLQRLSEDDRAYHQQLIVQAIARNAEVTGQYRHELAESLAKNLPAGELKVEIGRLDRREEQRILDLYQRRDAELRDATVPSRNEQQTAAIHREQNEPHRHAETDEVNRSAEEGAGRHHRAQGPDALLSQPHAGASDGNFPEPARAEIIAAPKASAVYHAGDDAPAFTSPGDDAVLDRERLLEMLNHYTEMRNQWKLPSTRAEQKELARVDEGYQDAHAKLLNQHPKALQLLEFQHLAEQAALHARWLASDFKGTADGTRFERESREASQAGRAAELHREALNRPLEQIEPSAPPKFEPDARSQASHNKSAEPPTPQTAPGAADFKSTGEPDPAKDTAAGVKDSASAREQRHASAEVTQALSPQKEHHARPAPKPIATEASASRKSSAAPPQSAQAPKAQTATQVPAEPAPPRELPAITLTQERLRGMLDRYAELRRDRSKPSSQAENAEQSQLALRQNAAHKQMLQQHQKAVQLLDYQHLAEHTGVKAKWLHRYLENRHHPDAPRYKNQAQRIFHLARLAADTRDAITDRRTAASDGRPPGGTYQAQRQAMAQEAAKSGRALSSEERANLPGSEIRQRDRDDARMRSWSADREQSPSRGGQNPRSTSGRGGRGR